jgi:hypothetical protein
LPVIEAFNFQRVDLDSISENLCKSVKYLPSSAPPALAPGASVREGLACAKPSPRVACDHRLAGPNEAQVSMVKKIFHR